MSNFLPFRKPLRSLTRISLSVLLCDGDTPGGVVAGIVAWRGAAPCKADSAALNDG